MPNKIILVHPPIVKCSNPSAGIAKLSACLNVNKIKHEIIDANLEGILFLLERASGKNTAKDRWTTRAAKNLEHNLSVLRNITTYRNQSRYQRAVMDINRLLNAAGKSYNADISLADYQDKRLYPVKSADLIAAAASPQAHPFYLYFQQFPQLEGFLS